MDDLLLHEQTRRALERVLTSPPHAICLIGAAGAGKGYVALTVAHTLLDSKAEDACYVVKPEKASISISQVRELQAFLRLRKPGTARVRRVVIIEDADTMSDEAQNALLKTLEEPPADTVFVLTATGSSNLKPTIYSRVQRVVILPVNLADAERYFRDTNELKKAFALSGGNVGLLHALLHDPEHDLVKAVEEAKQLMKASAFDRLKAVDRLSKSKESLPHVLYALDRVLSAALVNARAKPQIKRLISGQRAVYEATQDLGRSANTKLLLTDLMLQL